MAVNSIIGNQKFLRSNFLRKNLEFAAENGALYSAGVSFALSAVVRPLVILSTPKAETKDKQYAGVKSISSALVGLGVMGLITTPVVRAVNKVKHHPEKFLSPKALKFYTSNPKNFAAAEQFTKIGSAFLTAHPKSFFTAALIPPLMELIFAKPNRQEENKNVKFGQKVRKDILSKGVASLYNSEFFQKFTERNRNTNLPQHLFCANDVLLTGLFMQQTMKNKKIEKDKRKTLAINAALMTGITIAGTYIIDKITNPLTQKFIRNFKEANKENPKLGKYLDGIKIIKPIFILGGLYYIAAPILATFLADKITKDTMKNG